MKTLSKAVIEQIGDRDSLEDVARHGADGGVPGFTYYWETVEFFNANKAAILDLVFEQADGFGLSKVDFVKGFNCIDEVDQGIEDEIGEIVYGDGDSTTIKNALAWFALEEIARNEFPEA